jgi:hypothetical protein
MDIQILPCLGTHPAFAQEDRMFTQKNAALAATGFCLLTALFAGCSSRPVGGQSRADLQKWFERQWPKTISVVEYLQTRAEGDEKRYTIYFRARARFIKDTEGCVSTCCGDICFDKRIRGFRWLSKKSDNPHVVQKGDLFEVEGMQTYQKTGSGWVNEDLHEGGDQAG